MKEMDKELIELIKRNDFKTIKKKLKPLGSKYVKNFLEPYIENKFGIDYHKNLYSIVRYVNKFNKKQSELFLEHIKGNLQYDEKNWNKNIYKFDILIPESIALLIENSILDAKINDGELYNFLINNRSGIYCIILKIYKFWFSNKNQNDIEVKKLYENNFEIDNFFVRISREEFKKYSENYIKILNYLDAIKVVFTDHFHRPTVLNKEKNIFKPGICKGYRLNPLLVNIQKNAENKFFIIRINNKKSVISLYHDYISQKEVLINKDDSEEYFSDEENLYYLKNYSNRPKRIGISDDCKELIKKYNDNLIVTPIEEMFDYVDKHYSELIDQGIKRNKLNLIEKIYDYLNFFELRYDDADEDKFKNFNYFLDRTGRFYTFFNHCPKEIITEMFKIKNSKGNVEKLVEIDMRSCHLNMLALLFNKNVLKNFSIRNFVGPELLNWFERKLEKIPIEQLNAFKNLCSSSDYYQKMANLINEKSEIKYDIDSIKKMNMYFLYGNNIYNPIVTIFKFYFPFVIDFLNEVKKNFHSQSKLSYLLMRLESYFFIDKGIASVLKEGITVLPKHDCYYVAVSDAQKVRNILTNIYLELTEGDINYIPSYDRETSRIKSLFSKTIIDKKIVSRNVQLKKFINKTREERIKNNLYTNIYYKEFNDFLLNSGIKKLKVDRKLNVDKFKKILDRLVKLSADDNCIKFFEYLYDIYESKNYEKFVKENKKYNFTFLKFVIAEYISEDIKNKTIQQPIFISKQKISNTKIITPYEFYLKKTNESSGLKDRQVQQNYLLY